MGSFPWAQLSLAVSFKEGNHASCHAMSCSHPHLEVMRIARCGWPPCLHPARQSIIAADEVNFGVEFFFGVVDGWLVFSHELQGFIYSTIPPEGQMHTAILRLREVFGPGVLSYLTIAYQLCKWLTCGMVEV